jgi:hypothetical protein
MNYYSVYNIAFSYGGDYYYNDKILKKNTLFSFNLLLLKDLSLTVKHVPFKH